MECKTFALTYWRLCGIVAMKVMEDFVPEITVVIPVIGLAS